MVGQADEQVVAGRPGNPRPSDRHGVAVVERVIVAGGMVVRDHGKGFDVHVVGGDWCVQHEFQGVAIHLGGVPEAGGGVEPTALLRGQAQDVQGRHSVADRAGGRRQDGDLSTREAVVEMLQQGLGRWR